MRLRPEFIYLNTSGFNKIRDVSWVSFILLICLNIRFFSFFILLLSR